MFSYLDLCKLEMATRAVLFSSVGLLASTKRKRLNLNGVQINGSHLFSRKRLFNGWLKRRVKKNLVQNIQFKR